MTQYVRDNLQNMQTGLGGDRDKGVGGTFVAPLITDVELQAMYEGDWISRKIVDIIPNDMTREWRDWQADQKQIEDIEAYEKRPSILIQQKVNKALKTGRLAGGSLIYLGMRDRTPAIELNPEAVRKDDLEFIHVINKHDVTVGDQDRDIMSANYGQPKYYELKDNNGAPVRIHPSRVIKFGGSEVLMDTNWTRQGWEDSVLRMTYSAISNAASVQQHVAALIPELKMDVIHIPGLFDLLANEVTRKKVIDRFAHAATIKSMFGIMLLDGNPGKEGGEQGGEVWDQKQINFAQMPELVRLYLEIVSGATDIPITRFLGQSPGGLNSTGEGDLRNYYDNIAARQRTDLQAGLERLDEVIIRSALGSRPEEIYYEWSPLWGMSEKEKAEIFKIKAEAARTLVGTGGASEPIIPINAISDALVNAFIEDGCLPGLDTAIDEYGKLADQEDDEEDVLAAAGLVAANQPQMPGNPAQPNPGAAPAKKVAVGDATPRTLYVKRDVRNGAEILAWARSQGFANTLEASDLHVTIVYSEGEVDWMKMGEAWEEELTISAGGPRVMEQFGEARVLAFASSALGWRHERAKEIGATYKHAEYQPHITISYDPDGPDLSEVEPYKGKIVLGPEIFEEINPDWSKGK